MEARLAVFPLMFIVLLLLIGVIAGVAVAASRKGNAGGLVFGLLVAGAVTLPILLVGFVTTRTVVHPMPPTVVYVQPPVEAMPIGAPMPPVAPDPMPIPGGATRILGPEEVPPGVTAPPAEVPQTSAEIPSEPVAVATKPDWIEAGEVREGDRTYVVVSGQQFADAAAARQDAIGRAAQVVYQDFVSAFRPSGQWLFTPRDAEAVALRDSFTEEIRRTAGENEFTVYRTHLKVELSPGVRHAIEPIWRQQVSTGRSVITGSLLGLLTAVCAVLAGYFRLDDRTAGRYRWRLRFGSVAAVGLAAVAAVGVMTFFPIRSFSAPALPDPVAQPSTPADPAVVPPGTEAAQPQADIDSKTRERFLEVADRMVTAINAEDYEGVRQDFNKSMLDTFPVERCRTFFGREVSDRFGRIDGLESPRFTSAATASLVARCERGTLDLTLALDEHGRVAGMLFRPRPVSTCPPFGRG